MGDPTPAQVATGVETLSLTVEFSGGLEMLFDDQKRVLIDLPTAEAEGKPTLAFLIGYLCKNVMKDTRKELFVLDDHINVQGSLALFAMSVVALQCCVLGNGVERGLEPFVHNRPGILVLINDADWELEGEEAYELQAGDNILFVSTLHGG